MNYLIEVLSCFSKYIIIMLAFTVFAGQALVPVTPAVAAEDEMLALYFDDTAMQETTSRTPKPLSRTPENVTVITAEVIKAMHAHSVAEILSRQAGVMLTFTGHEIIGDGPLYLLGTRRYHVLFLLDGIRLNLTSAAHAIPNFIPVGIIKRIEIIKGPASATWGSSLGGVVNVITKDTGDSTLPTGSLQASYGEANTREISGDLAGGIQKAGYYLFAGNIDSDGLRDDRYSARDSLYGKGRLSFAPQATLTVSGGKSAPSYKTNISSWNQYEEVTNDNIWGAASVDAQLGDRFGLHLELQRYENDFSKEYRVLRTEAGDQQGDLVWNDHPEEKNTMLNGRLSYTGRQFSANLGVENSRSEYVWSYIWAGALTVNAPLKEERRGVYVNATYISGPMSFSAGLRHDHHTLSKDLVSPSLGFTWLLADDTLFRATVSRGFSVPTPTYLAYYNSDLKPEIIWAYQAGIETRRIPGLLCKLAVFHYNVDDAWDFDLANSGRARWKGFEIETRTDEFHGFSLQGNFTYASEDSMYPASAGSSGPSLENDVVYTVNLILNYRHTPTDLNIKLAGNYLWLNEDMGNFASSYDTSDMLCDLTVSKGLDVGALDRAELFVKARNIFNGNQYWDEDYPNPERWVEAGMSLGF